MQRAGLVAAGAVAADQLELLDRLGWVRSLFPGWGAPTSGRAILTLAESTYPAWEAIGADAYVMCVSPLQWDAMIHRAAIRG
jgi:hypothetical protein